MGFCVRKLAFAPVGGAHLLVALLLLFATVITNVQGSQKDVQAEKGSTVSLPCAIDSDQCGDLHSIKWYRGAARIYVYSYVPLVLRPEGNNSRMEVQYDVGSKESILRVRALELSDEAVYKCEITYMEVRENCDVVQFVNLTTLVKPTSVRVTDGDGNVKVDGEKLGPLNERSVVTLVCEAVGGKPVPSVAWYNGSQKMEQGVYETVMEGTQGVGTGRSRLQVTLSRGDLLARYECRAENDALVKPIVIGLDVAVLVRPTQMNLTGVGSHVIKDANVALDCNVYGANPAANVTWYNGSVPIVSELVEISKNRTITHPDGTFETHSRLIFKATRFENEQSITCEADNEVMRAEVERPMHRTVRLEVRYPPIVFVQPDNITVNESTDVRLHCNYESNPASLNVTQWLKNKQVLPIKDNDHYYGGTTEHIALVIKNVSREDMGEYACILGNEVGSEMSENSVFLNVHYKPIVKLVMDPPSPIVQKNQINVTLRCDVESGNPSTLLAVNWYMDGDILKSLPECNGTLEDPLCDIDPSRLFLQTVEKEFAGNHTCEGMNEAGWGPRSNNTELIVYYPPSNSKLEYSPLRVEKKKKVTLTCSVQYPGQPETTHYRWLRGEHLAPNVTTFEWVINPVTLETRSEFTCIPYNDGGEAEPASVTVEVVAPPLFISNLPPYSGALYNGKNVSISCRIECYPECDIIWRKNKDLLDIKHNNLYYVQNTRIPKDIKTNDFESILSVLVWNMTNWPNKQLDRLHDNANYSCESTMNGVGNSTVKSTTYFAVEFPPENITLSNEVLNVIEGHIPENVLCDAVAQPDATFTWRREGNNAHIANGDKLALGHPVLRRDGGNYYCDAFNRHGTIFKATFLNILFKPECQISQAVMDGDLVLLCTVKANPEEVNFIWKIKNDNDTVVEDRVENNGLTSILRLDSGIGESRTYSCYANNSVGMSYACERDVTGAIGAWWKRLSNTDIIMLVGVSVGLIICVIIICVIIIIVCRRKRASDKCPSQSSTADKTGLNPGSPPEALTDSDRGVYENLPFHGMQTPPNKPFRPEFSDLDYADVDYRSYGPINYKAASINKLHSKPEDQEYDDLL